MMKEKSFTYGVIILSVGVFMICGLVKDGRGENWIFYSNLSGKGFYDKDSIKKISKNSITVWTKVFPSQEWLDLRKNMRTEYNRLLKEEGGEDPHTKRKVNDDEVFYQKTLVEVNCKTGSYRYLKMITYNKSDVIIWSSDDEKKTKDDLSKSVNKFEPNTPGYRFYTEVCQ
jgi:hypothetical protein